MSDSELEEMALSVVAAACSTFIKVVSESTEPTRGGSKPGKKANNNLHRVVCAERIDADYFCRHSSEQPRFTEQEFERRYRMPRIIYERIREGIYNDDRFFQQQEDGLGVPGATTDQKLATTLQQLAMGIS